MQFWKDSCSSHDVGSYSAQQELHEVVANVCNVCGQLWTTRPIQNFYNRYPGTQNGRRV